MTDKKQSEKARASFPLRKLRRYALAVRWEVPSVSSQVHHDRDPMVLFSFSNHLTCRWSASCKFSVRFFVHVQARTGCPRNTWGLHSTTSRSSSSNARASFMKRPDTMERRSSCSCRSESECLKSARVHVWIDAYSCLSHTLTRIMKVSRSLASTCTLCTCIPTCVPIVGMSTFICKHGHAISTTIMTCHTACWYSKRCVHRTHKQPKRCASQGENKDLRSYAR